MNSREKGKRGERAWRDELRAQGYDARRGQQFAGGGDSPDVISELPFHFEVKFVENLNLRDAMEQAARDAAPGKPPVVAHKRSNSPWLVTMRAEDWFALVREVFPKTLDSPSVTPCVVMGEQTNPPAMGRRQQTNQT
jgi:hypothetical protein